VVTAGGDHPWIIINALAEHFSAVDVIIERSEPRRTFLARRMRRQGAIAVAGQFITMIAVRIGKRLLAGRIDRLIAEAGMDPRPRADPPVTHVETINASDFVAAVDRLAPQAILLAGCRIMRADILQAMPCPVLNYHAGITPAYRGMNGGYWARVNDDPQGYGATVHLVDAGVDTGAILAQTRLEPRADDTIMTDAYRLADPARRLCIDSLQAAIAGTLITKAPSGPSQQWYHPAIWTYLRHGLLRGIW
jgi:methionyl-tRNA formyltransferase